MTNKQVVYGVSFFDSRNVKLFNFVEDNPRNTILKIFKRVEDGLEETFVGIEVDVEEDGNINMLSMMFAQTTWDNDDHCQATGVTPKIYFLWGNVVKVKIKSFNGNLPHYLTLGKHYEVVYPDDEFFSDGLYYILDDCNDSCLIYLEDCSYLNGGEWEIVDEQ